MRYSKLEKLVEGLTGGGGVGSGGSSGGIAMGETADRTAEGTETGFGSTFNETITEQIRETKDGGPAFVEARGNLIYGAGDGGCTLFVMVSESGDFDTDGYAVDVLGPQRTNDSGDVQFVTGFRTSFLVPEGYSYGFRFVSTDPLNTAELDNVFETPLLGAAGPASAQTYFEVRRLDTDGGLVELIQGVLDATPDTQARGAICGMLDCLAGDQLEMRMWIAGTSAASGGMDVALVCNGAQYTNASINGDVDATGINQITPFIDATPQFDPVSLASYLNVAGDRPDTTKIPVVEDIAVMVLGTMYAQLQA